MACITLLTIIVSLAKPSGAPDIVIHSLIKSLSLLRSATCPAFPKSIHFLSASMHSTNLQSERLSLVAMSAYGMSVSLESPCENATGFFVIFARSNRRTPPSQSSFLCSRSR